MLFQLLLLGAVIGSNNLATALAIGSLGKSTRRWRVALVFGIFEFTIPLVGLWIGQQASKSVAETIFWLGPAILAALGAWIIFSAFRPEDDIARLAEKVTTWRGLIGLSAALSIDNLIAGFSLGLGELEPVSLAATIGIFAIVFAYVGMQIGDRAQEKHRKVTKAGTGIMLVALGGAVALGVI